MAKRTLTKQIMSDFEKQQKINKYINSDVCCDPLYNPLNSPLENVTKTKEKYDVVCDIETFGTESNQLVYSIAAYVCPRSVGQPVMCYNKALNISKVKNFEVSGSTLAWWCKTNPDLFVKDIINEHENQTDKLYSERELFDDFYHWLNTIEYQFPDCSKENLYLWGNGILFDNRFIKDKLTQYGLGYPIYYRNDRDIRTLIEMAADKIGCESNKEFMEIVKDKNKTDHIALDDVANEYLAMRYAWEVLGLYQ